MANIEIKPFGNTQEMPAGYPIANDLKTNDAQQALSAAMGVKIGALLDADDEDNTSGWASVDYLGKNVVLPKKHSVRYKAVDGIVSGQGCAIYGDYLFRLYDGGTCKVYNISSGAPVLAGSFDLGSKMSANHANTAQFAPAVESGYTFPLLYVSCCNYNSTNGNRCFVERVTTSGATLVQTISVDPSVYQNNANVQIGDDGYIYMYTGSSTYHVFKFRKVLATEGDVSLTSADIIWHREIVTSYPYSTHVWQGGKIYNGKLYWVFGQTSGNAGWWTFDIETSSLDNIVYLSPSVSVELEDFDVYGNYMYFVCYGTTNMYFVYPVKL